MGYQNVEDKVPMSQTQFSIFSMTKTSQNSLDDALGRGIEIDDPARYLPGLAGMRVLGE